MHRVGHHVGAAAHQHAEREIELPRPLDRRRERQPGGEHQHAGQNHDARPTHVQDAPDHRAYDRRHQKTEREGAGGEAAIPAELIDQRRHQQGERGPGGHAQGHRHKRDADDHPAVIKRQAGRPMGGMIRHGTSGDGSDSAVSQVFAHGPRDVGVHEVHAGRAHGLRRDIQVTGHDHLGI